MRALAECDDAAPYVARAAASTSNPEVRKRTTILLARYQDSAWASFQKEYPAMLAQKELERLIDGMVFWRERLDNRGRDALMAVVDGIMDQTVAGRLKKKPAINLRPQFVLVNKWDTFDTSDSTIPLADRQLKGGFGLAAPGWPRKSEHDCRIGADGGGKLCH